MSVRVLQVIGGSKFGGAVWVVLSYVEALQEHGCEVTVCTSVEPVAEVFRGAGCEILSIPEMTRDINPPRDLLALIKLTKICRKGRFDVVHTHTSKGGFIGRAAARLAGVPIVFHTAHGFAFHESSSPVAVAVYTRLERLASRWSDRVLTVSDFHRHWAITERLAAPERIVTVRNGVSRSRLVVARDRRDFRGELGVEASDVLLVSVGRLATQKGLGTLLQALPKLLRRGVRARLVLVGEGPLRSALEEQITATALTATVSFLGFRSDVGDILNASDIVIAPSLWEGLSISVLEAMASGKPIVATNIGSNLELLEDGVSGLLVPPNDPERFADAILTLALDPDAASRYGAAARERFELGFTERAMKDALWAAYRSLLEQKLVAKEGPRKNGDRDRF
ncbi:MAG: glycosyltransferase family 4 protein [Gaiellaceae bacterium]